MADQRRGLYATSGTPRLGPEPALVALVTTEKSRPRGARASSLADDSRGRALPGRWPREASLDDSTSSPEREWRCVGIVGLLSRRDGPESRKGRGATRGKARTDRRFEWGLTCRAARGERSRLALRPIPENNARHPRDGLARGVEGFRAAAKRRSTWR
ncbi:hypothetical protein THAOC_22349 [Thalassiosira oceanica]|uniref:Uncharacterized protein n=1 Tax=Thalassiosira oceanica TaxID=159749 RepID=K0SG84_THAOC|nr:hypothetical protein THAOC_22349 [Thalassiosira oceanica]|eukprot:EJK57592.1 hypothetical protein THAOC_22349 [Thalassiosira oceanica]